MAEKQASRRSKLSKLDSSDCRVIWRDEDEKKEAEEAFQKMESAFSSIIKLLGDGDPGRDGLKRSSERAAKALLYFTKGYEESLKS